MGMECELYHQGKPAADGAEIAFLKKHLLNQKETARPSIDIPDTKATQTSTDVKRPLHAIPSGEQVKKAQSNADPAWIVNGKDKLPKLQRVCGTTDNVRAVFIDQQANKVGEVIDVFRQHTDVNKLLGKGEFTLQFYDKDGTLLNSTAEFKQSVILK